MNNNGTQKVERGQRGKEIFKNWNWITYGSFVEGALEHSRFAGQKLDHLAHRHSRGEAVRVHDDVGADALVGEGHVLLLHDDAANSLLAMSAAEFVPQLGSASATEEHLDQAMILRAGSEEHLPVC